MSISDKDKKKLNEIHNLLSITLKSSTLANQKSRILKNLKTVESLLNDINEGKWINPIKLRNILNGFSNQTSIKTNKQNTTQINHNTPEGYLEKIEIVNISRLNNDYEIDCIYSYFEYFKRNFLQPIGKNNLELNYNLNKKRDEFINKSENIDKLLKDYREDLEILTQITEKEKAKYYNSKFVQRRKNLFLQCAEMFVIGNKFTNKIIHDRASDDGGVFNGDHIFVGKYNLNNSSIFERQTNYYILKELKTFTEEILSFLNIPGYESER